MKVSNTVPCYYPHAFNKTAGNRFNSSLRGSTSNPPESNAVVPSKGSAPSSPYTNDRTTDYLPSELNLSDCNVQGDGFSVRKHVLSAAPRFESNRFKAPPRHKRVEHASIDEEFAGPALLRVRRIADGYVSIDRAHCGLPFELVLLLLCLK